MEEPGECSEGNLQDRVRHHQAVQQSTPQKVYKKYRVRACLEQCKYNVVHDLVEDRKWKECVEADDWNICWNDWSILLDRVLRMKAYQKINHFPGMNEITRKDTLARNMNRARKLCPEEYNIFPITFQIPQDANDFRYYYQQNKDKKTVYISKPVASCQGRGIKLFRAIENIDLSEPQVIQEYIAKPYLINGLKFDLRTYVVVLQVVPFLLMVYYEDGMARFCTEPYQEPSAKNLKKAFMHLTNYAINKQNDNFEYNSDDERDDCGSKWGLSAVWDKMEQDGADVAEFKRKMWDIQIKTLFSILPGLQHAYTSARPTQPRFGDANPYDCQEPYFGSSCFEILGFDIMITSDFQPILIEVNHSPSFRCDTPLDLRIKEGVISGTLDLMWIEQDDKILFSKLEKMNAMKRLYGKHEGRITQVSQYNKKGKKEKGIKTVKPMPTFSLVQQHIQQFLQQNQDKFKQIYPLPVNTPDPYEQIYQKIKNPHAREPERQDAVIQGSVPRGPAIKKQPDMIAVKSRSVSEKSLPQCAPQPAQQQAQPQASVKSRPQSSQQVSKAQPIQILDQIKDDTVDNDELPISSKPIDQEDPMAQILKRAFYEIEYGIDTKQIAFRGINGPILLPQGALRNDKIEKAVEQDLNSKLRAMMKFGLREQVDALIRQGQRIQGQVSMYNQLPAQPQRIDVFQVLTSNGTRSKSIANPARKLQVMKPYYKIPGRDDMK